MIIELQVGHAQPIRKKK